MAETFLQKFSLFIPGKDKKEVEQPAYGTDMRTIEQWGLLVAKYIQSVVAQFINSFHSAPLFNFGNVIAGSVPSANQQLLGQAFTVSFSATSGAGSVPVSGFSTGYSGVVCPSGIVGQIYTIQPGSSSLSALALSVFTDAGTPVTGAAAVSVILVGVGRMVE